MPRVYADNDILLKAAHWQLLDEVPACAQADWTQVSVLDSLAHRARRADRRLFRAPVFSQELLARLAKCAPLPNPPPAIVAQLQSVTGLDAGEVILVACAIADPESRLLTGDKRALRALATGSCRSVALALKGRIVCVEHLVHHALDRMGAEALALAIGPYRSEDTAMACIVSPHATEASIREGLGSYLRALEAETGGLVLADI